MYCKKLGAVLLLFDQYECMNKTWPLLIFWPILVTTTLQTSHDKDVKVIKFPQFPLNILIDKPINQWQMFGVCPAMYAVRSVAGAAASD